MSLQGIKDFIKEKSIKQWELVDVSAKGGTTRKVYEHMIIDQPGIGESEWSRVVTKLRSFLTDS